LNFRSLYHGQWRTDNASARLLLTERICISR